MNFLLNTLIFIIALTTSGFSEDLFIENRTSQDKFYDHSILNRLSQVPSETNTKNSNLEQRSEIIEIGFIHWYLVINKRSFSENKSISHSLKKRLKILNFDKSSSMDDVFRIKKFGLDLKSNIILRDLPVDTQEVNDTEKAKKLIDQYWNWIHE